MSRVARTKLLILLVVIVVAGGTVALAVVTDFALPVLLGVLALALAIRTVQRRVLREFFQGRRLLAAGRPEEALELFRRCRARLQAEPWRLRWFVRVSLYTPSADAMLLNYIGSAHLSAGHLDEAEQAFREALAQDPLFAVPHYNRAVLAAVRGHRTAAERHLAEAAA